MNITELEKQALENYITNNYGDVPHHCVWSFALAEDGHNRIDKSKISGIVSSLAKKGLVLCDGEGNEATTQLTNEGQKLAYKLFHTKYDWMQEFKDKYLA